MTRKIFVLVNIQDTLRKRGLEKPCILSSYPDSVLVVNGTGEHVSSTRDQFELEFGIDLSGYDVGDDDGLHYFKRRAQARRAKRAIEDSNAFSNAELRIHELGEYDRNLKPVSSWKIEARVSESTAWKDEPGEWFVYATGHATRNAAREDVAAARSVQQQRLSQSPQATQYDYRVVPVYA